ncbi:hypothetical protein PUNSTDRAFT_52073 [Punctularia strigosozonata HHB-11173 SS5]|uniref:uncharacterized protein n=1 Tax=Punctularia strigosozonata (strain HHB-11173) TaxID=741275 RepID=UPI0004416988|nr:uncharacterized protein PUNSTDRAFT_52073 [Punctularia strigosozonata HHB-11173 SS5]EIN09931.1 hypothetical protein PUNSTDRAFT_52073 [Punctularia strigosozonata HHB-11173 SS5]
MGPPAPVAASSSRYYPNAAAAAEAAPQQSLFASILAQPPDKRGRTIHNPSAPPVAAPSRTESLPRYSSRRSDDMRSPRTRPRGNSHSGVAEPSTSGRHSHARTRSDKGKRKERQLTVPNDDVDMKAAATLTSLLLSARPSVSSIPTSPRSTFSGADGSDAGSAHSLHFAQSSARSTGRASTPPRSRTQSERGSVGGASSGGDREVTPTNTASTDVRQGTPQRTDPDTEAADLMLYLATSPSPARPNANRERGLRDAATLGSLGSGEGLRAKPRVLFPGASEEFDDPEQFSLRLPDLGDGTGEPVAKDYATVAPRLTNMVPKSPVSTSSNSSYASMSSAMPTLTAQSSLTSVGTANSSFSSSGVANSSFTSAGMSGSYSSSHPFAAAPSTPGDFSFNFNDFINVSPSPATFGKPREEGAVQHKPALTGLRPELGRKLFEEEQSRVAAQQAQGMSGGSRNALGAGIDLVGT